MPHITCFQHIDCEGPGSLLEILKAKEVRINVLKPFQGDPVPAHLGDGLVVLGGPMGVYEEKQYPWMTAELNAIRKCLDSSLPVLGICLGSQMLAHAAGGNVYKGQEQEVGWYPITPTERGHLDSLLLGLPREFNAFHWHGDTFTLPSRAALLAGSAKYPHQIFRVGTNAYGFQCHLEVTAEMVKSWMQVYAKELVPQGGPIPPEPIEEHLAENAAALNALAENVFARFAALL
ncbi:MAG TPA: type 1 glutamine amidotransferase [bacterium]|nr:type 1 glutamine amidotransferase [bacterium]